MSWFRFGCLLGLLLSADIAAAGMPVAADEPVATVLADFEDNTVSGTIAEVENVAAADCTVRFEAVPARGQQSLSITVGATTKGASASCDLTFQSSILFSNASRAAAMIWINEGDAAITFRIRDARGRVFETSPGSIKERKRWARLEADLGPGKLTQVAAGKQGAPTDSSPLEWPIEFAGLRVITRTPARQTVYIDDLQVEHRAPDREAVAARFLLDHQTHIYAPGQPIAARLLIENLSRKKALPQFAVQITWRRADNSELTSSRSVLNLPASSAEFRSRQTVDVAHAINEIGLFRLVATLTQPGWSAPATFETTVAVAPSNRALSRGRSTFFGVRTNSLRESAEDQLLEIDLAREIGVQMIALETPWRLLEPRPEAFDFTTIDPILSAISARDMVTMLVLGEPPPWAALDDASKLENQQVALLTALTSRFARKVQCVQVVVPRGATPADCDPFVNRIRAQLKTSDAFSVVGPALDVRQAARSAAPPATMPGDSGISTFIAGGGAASAAAAFDEFCGKTGHRWRATDWWEMNDAPPNGPGRLSDAIAALQFFVHAASSHVGAVLWADLRDDTTDARYPDRMRGLVRRDFSPRAALLGYASAVGMLNGLVYSGALPGTPDSLQSALFIGPEQQVAVLLPQPNAALPLVIAPSARAAGTLTLLDFERRTLLPLDAPTGLVQMAPRPMFISFAPERTQESPQIELAKSWVRAPSEIVIAEKASLPVEIDVRAALFLKYAQLVLPEKSPLSSSFSARDLQADAGKTAQFRIELQCKSPAPFQALPITLRVAMNDRMIDLPIVVRQLLLPKPIAASESLIADPHRLGALRQAQSDDNRALPVYVAARPAALDVAIELPSTTTPASGLRFGLSLENSPATLELTFSKLHADPTMALASSAPLPESLGIHAERVIEKASGKTHLRFSIPSLALGAKDWRPGVRLRAAATYAPSLDNPVVGVMQWGSGSDGGPMGAGFECLQLGATQP